MKYFDELQEGESYVTPGRTITETDVVMFAAMSGDYNEIHTNAEVAKKGQFGGRLAHGLLCLSISHGLMFRTALLDGSAIAFLGIDELSFTKPVMIGDTLHGEFHVEKLVPSRSKPDRGVAYFRFNLVNQKNETVQSCIKKLLMMKKPV